MTPFDQLKLETYCSGMIRYATDPAARLQAYTDAYGLFFSQVGGHPQFNLPDDSYIRYSRQLVDKLEPQFGGAPRPLRQIVELGCGRGFLTAELARRFPAAQCLGIDVALDAAGRERPANLTYMRANILEGDLPMRDADLVVSDQVLEHFHADDVARFVATAAAALRPGGLLFIGTPNRVWGPHDVSGTFRLAEPVGFHLKEYDGAEVVSLLSNHGLKFHSALIMLRERGRVLSLAQYLRLESMITRLPLGTRQVMRDKRALGWANIRFLFQKS